MASDRPVSLRLSHDLLAEIDRRTRKADDDSDREYGRADAIRGAINRYYEVCRRHLAALDLSHGELAVCCDVLNGGLLGLGTGDERDASRLSIVWAEIADTFRLHKGYGVHHGVSDDQGKLLVDKLQRASYADMCALVDFVERFWADDEDANKLIYPDSKE
ncbi:MAG: hypothetical protein H0X39_16725 [Actinobacteria bacterium]|nr:hypothetical protein [Actinomycetota bacterium]